MKKIFSIFFILSLSLRLCAQKKLTSQDSIKVFYDELFVALKSEYLLRKSVDWQVVKTETKQNSAQYTDFENSLSEIKTLFDKIGATHCGVYYKQNKYAATGKKISKDDYSAQWAKKYATKPVFEAKVLNGKIGYILMPRMVFFDISSKNIHNIAQSLYDQIAEIKTKNKLEGWIIDLRFNTGGNSWPMLLSLYDFLGDNEIVGSLNENKKIKSKVTLSKGSYIENNKTVSYINPKGELLDKVKVAVITGVLTGSSGEVTAIAFKGRPNTTFIGENTLGFTTGNFSWPLPYDVTLALTNSYYSDRNGNHYEKIIPDVAVSKSDNFDDLLLDKNIQESIKFITKKG
ncbi:S41 family peptidase [Pedobacter jamesrossensis]|uniref:S41 family peptidase n=1 Tax=Pedobacter jamesrossensis TaxID=1908238 RepID=A0ABV8NL04_9SPHI